MQEVYGTNAGVIYSNPEMSNSFESSKSSLVSSLKVDVMLTPEPKVNLEVNCTMLRQKKTQSTVACH